jgi:hypothetical protein
MPAKLGLSAICIELHMKFMLLSFVYTGIRSSVLGSIFNTTAIQSESESMVSKGECRQESEFAAPTHASASHLRESICNHHQGSPAGPMLTVIDRSISLMST